MALHAGDVSHPYLVDARLASVVVQRRSELLRYTVALPLDTVDELRDDEIEVVGLMRQRHGEHLVLHIEHYALQWLSQVVHSFVKDVLL